MGKRGPKAGVKRGPRKSKDMVKKVTTYAIEANLLDKLKVLEKEKKIKSKSDAVNKAIKEYLKKYK